MINIPVRSPSFVATAEAFADAAHTALGQVRKFTNEPYIEHPRRVAGIFASFANRRVDNFYEALAACYLHDVVEDTPITIEHIHEKFGPIVANLVAEVTDVSTPEDGNRAARKAIDRQHLANASSLGQSIKLADLIDNTRDIKQHDPKFAKVYLAEKAELLKVLTRGDRLLYQLAERMI